MVAGMLFVNVDFGSQVECLIDREKAVENDEAGTSTELCSRSRQNGEIRPAICMDTIRYDRSIIHLRLP